MNLSQLQYFKTLAKEEHYTRAAQILSITQPSLSHAIAQLEQELADMEELKQSYEQQEASLNQVINEKKAVTKLTKPAVREAFKEALKSC